MEEQRVAIRRMTSSRKMSVAQSVTITRGGFVLSMLSLEISIHIILNFRDSDKIRLSFEQGVPHLIWVNLG